MTATSTSTTSAMQREAATFAPRFTSIDGIDEVTIHHAAHH